MPCGCDMLPAEDGKAEPMVTVSEETAVDYELTAKIATEAFALAEVHFSAERIKWLYERGLRPRHDCARRHRRRPQGRADRVDRPEHLRGR
jgi:hypothetical protein